MSKFNRILIAMGIAVGAVLLMGASYSHGTIDSTVVSSGAVAALGVYSDGIANDDGAQWRKLAENETALLLETTFCY